MNKCIFCHIATIFLILIFIVACSKNSSNLKNIISELDKPSPKCALPNQCQVPDGFYCENLTSDGKKVSFKLGTASGYEITDVSVNVMGCYNIQGQTTLAYPEFSTYTMECDIVSGKRFSGNLTIRYKDVDGLAEIAKGKIGIKPNSCS